MKLLFIGTGYVGLVSGTCFADLGHEVTCVDIDREKVDKLNRGIIPIYEPGLHDMVLHNVARDRLKFTTNLNHSVKEADAVFICVGTPSKEDKSADLSQVESAAKTIGQSLDRYTVVIDKSTVPPGTAQRVTSIIQSELLKRKIDVPFDVVSNPEFLKEGTAIDDFLKPDRVIIGLPSERPKPLMEELYRTLVLSGSPIQYTNTVNAELIKYACNGHLALRISYMNELSGLAEQFEGADIKEIRTGMASDKRIGPSFLHPGPGYGGSCFPKDVRELVNMYSRHGLEGTLANAIEIVNEAQKASIVPRLQKHIPNLEDKVVGIWGLTFKPKTDDMRESPSITIINQLSRNDALVQVYDPEGMPNAKTIFGTSIIYTVNAYDAAKGADALIMLTEWPEFRNPSFTKLKSVMRGNVILDARNIYDPKTVRDHGFVYQGIGR